MNKYAKKAIWFTVFLIAALFLSFWLFPANAQAVTEPSAVNPLVTAETPNFGPDISQPAGTGEVTPVLPNPDGSPQVIKFRDIFTPDNMVILLAWFTALFTSWIKRIVKSQNWQTFAINVGLNVAAKGIFPLIWGVYGPMFSNEALEAAFSMVITGLIADKVLYEFFTHTSAKGAMKAQLLGEKASIEEPEENAPLLTNMTQEEVKEALKSAQFREFLAGTGAPGLMTEEMTFIPIASARPKGDVWDVVGSLLEFGIRYLIDQLTGKNYAADRVLEVVGPILRDMAQYKGRVSARVRLQFQGRIDDALRLLEAEGGQ